MPTDGIPCLDGAGVVGDVRGWTEDPLTARARAIWSGADFLPIARSFEGGAVAFISRLDIRPRETLLDVACGTGNLAIPAARAGARVSGLDIAPNLITQARLEARAAGLSIDFEVGDAECMPYPDGRFDTTVTMFGAMFTPRPARAAAELVRVTRPGGRIAMANWTPGGFVGHLLRAHATVSPPPEGVPSPLLWGDPDQVAERLAGVRELTCTRRVLHLSFRLPPAEVTALFAACYGPTAAILRAADPAGRRDLLAALTRLWTEHNLATDGGNTVVAGEYLEVQARVA